MPYDVDAILANDESPSPKPAEEEENEKEHVDNTRDNVEKSDGKCSLLLDVMW